MTKPLLGLVMITKNESVRIAEMLRTWAPYVDLATILDTGSTDDTNEIIAAELGDKATIAEEPFIDFGASRNRALELHGDRTVFTIMPNVDDLEGGDQLRSFLEAHRFDAANAYRVRIEPGRYNHPLVMRTGGGWRYQWRTHECATGDNVGPVIPDVVVLRDRTTRTPEQWKSRWERDRVILEEDSKKGDVRAWFYLGQTYECLGDHANALVAYIARAEMGGYFDEVFEAKMRVARMMEKLDRGWPEIQNAYLAAHAFDPRRAEPLYAIASHYYDREQHSLTYLFARRASELAMPETDLFGLEPEVYEWKAHDKTAISAYYLSRTDSSVRSTGKFSAEACVWARPDHEQFRKNLVFYAEGAAKAFPSYRNKRLDYQPEPGYVSTNPSVHFDGKVWRAIIRTTNYELDQEGRYLTRDPDGTLHPITEEFPINTNNVMAELNDELDIVRAVPMTDLAVNERFHRSRYPVHGYEDCRLFSWDGPKFNGGSGSSVYARLWATATVADFTDAGDREIALLELNDEYQVVSATPLRGPWSGVPQKNWMPLVDGGGRLSFVYATRPLAWLCYAKIPGLMTSLSGSSGSSGSAGMPKDCGKLRGGSQMVRISRGGFDGYLCLVHEVVWCGPEGRTYLHRWVMVGSQVGREPDDSSSAFNGDSSTIYLSDAFYFERCGIEFCCGLGYDGNRLVASFGVRDASANLGIFDPDEVLESLWPLDLT